MKQRLLKTGIPLPEAFNSSGGGIVKAFLTLLLMFVTMTASASWYVNLQFNNDTYGWSKSKGDREYTSYTTFNMSSSAPSFNGKSSDIKISFAGDFEDGRIEYAKNTTIRITAPDGYRIEQVLLDEPDRVGALSSQNYGNYSYSCTEGTGNNQKMVMNSKDAGLKEITLTTNGNRRRFRSRCIKVWIVKEVESWLNFPASYRVAPGSNISVATLSDYGGGNGNSYTATTSNGNIATYDAASNKLNGVNRGTASITVNYAGNDIYATGSKTFNVEVGNTNNLSIPNSNRVDVSVTRNGQTIAAGTPVFDLDQLTYRFTAKNGYTLLGSATVTRNAYEGFPMAGALKQENGTFLLSNAEDWTNFCYSGTTGNYRMTADITADRNAANQNTFNGTFDGDRHTLTVNYNTNSIANLAPFCNISEATIKNLHVAGSQYVRTRKYIGGLVGKVFGNNASNIENCEVSTALSYGDKDNCGAGGFIGEANASVNITNCIFNGSFSSQGTGFSGFVGAARKTSNKIQGCFMIATSIKENGNNSLFVSGNAQYSSTNYYVNPGNWTEQGYWTKVSQWQVASGELAYKCNLKQDLVGNNKDNVPHLFLDDSKRVLKGDFTLNGKNAFTSYTNPNQLFPLPTGIETVFSNKAATGDMTAEALQKDKDGYYLINNKNDWNILSYCYNKGDFNGFATNVRLNADINVNTMVGNINVAYSGTFNGQGHTLTVNYNVNNEERVAPFRTIDGATITNLRTAGTVASNKAPGMASGLVGNASGKASTISNCQSTVAITFTGSGDATHGGLLGRAQIPVTFNNCAFTGSMTADKGYCVGGFVGWAEQHVDINNCLVAANVKVQPSGRGNEGNSAFGRNYQQYSINNSYVVQFGNTDVNQGTYITDADVKSGAMTYILQNGQQSQYWGQTIGTDDKPMLTSNDDKHVYKASFKSGDKELAVTYANKNHIFPLPTVDNYMAVYDNTPATADIEVKMNPATSDGYFTIANKDEWNSFVALYNGTGNYRLTADITDPVNTMAGTSEQNPFKGTFDGAGHTLNVDITSNQAFAAPFRYVQGATIKNLNVAGTIHQTGRRDTECNHASGLTGRTDGVTLEKCVSSVALKFDIAGDIHSGGLVGHALSSTITINDCAFIGSITEQPGNRNASVGGLIGWGENNFKAFIKNSYVDQTLNGINEQNNLVRVNGGWKPENGSKFENCYYTVPDNVTVDWDPEPATKLTKEQVKNGYLANLLQNAHGNDIVWGQTLTGDTPDAQPVITTDASKRVYKATFIVSGKEYTASYANQGAAFPVPSLDGYSYTYDLSQTAGGDISVNLYKADVDGYLLITNKADWDNFANTYNGKGNFRLATDITEPVTTMVGSSNVPFHSSFDGAGHTLTVNYNVNEERVSPFRYINGATISNLRIAGNITSSKGPGATGGFAGEASGKASTFTNCESAVNLTFTGSGDATFAGFIGRTYVDVAFNSCAFTGSITAVNGNSVAGFVGWINDGEVTIDHSLSAGNITAQDGLNAPFARRSYLSTVTDSYYREFANINNDYRSGTLLTNDAQLKNGEMAYLLQNGQTNQYWGQTVGTDTLPTLTANATKHVYKATFKVGDEVFLTTYATQGQQFPTVGSGSGVTYINFSYADDLTATADKVIDYGNKPFTLILPKSNKYTVTAKLGEKQISDGDPITGSDALTFHVAPTTNYMLLSAEDMTMRAANSTTFVAFDEPTIFTVKDGYGLINNLTDWNAFAKYTKSGNYRLTADIDGITTMTSGTFRGTFDGQGHTLTVNYDLRNYQYGVAPFRSAEGATFKNLHITGNISSNEQYAAGFVGQTVKWGGPVSFSDCHSSVNLRWNGGQSVMDWGGFLGSANSSVSFDNCLFDGSMGDYNHSPNNRAINTGGFVGYAKQSVTIKNSLMAAEILSNESPSQTYGYVNATFGRSDNSGSLIHVETSYYLDNKISGNRDYGHYLLQGTALNSADERLKSGEITYTLQAQQKGLHWGQTLNTDNMPLLTADAAKHVFKNIFDGEEAGTYANTFIVDENKGNKANITANANGTGSVKFTRTFADGWNTLVLPFALTTEEVNKAFGDDAQVAYFTNEANNTVELNTKEDTKDIEANVPVLVKLDKAQAKDFTFAGKTITNAEAKTIGTNNISFIGSYDALFTVPKDDYYFINGTNLWKSEGKTTIKGTRAYFHAPGQSGAKLRLFIDGVEADGSATGISSVKGDELGDRSYSSAVYTLSGQKVADSLEEARKANLKTGVYIVNGKKVIIK